MKSFVTTALLAVASFSHAADINILHVANVPTASLEISTKGKSQTIQLESGSNSGSFTLPNATSTIKLTDPAGASLQVPSGKSSHIAILYTKKDTPTWHLQPTKPSDGKNSLRVINLTATEQTITFADNEHKIDSEKVIDLGQTEKPSMKIQVVGAKSRTLKPEDPAGYLAVLYTTEEGTKIAFIAER